MQWIRRSFIAGFFVMVPLIISVAALVWAFQLVDGVMVPLYIRLLGREIPGLGLATTLLVVFVVGTLATNVFGKRILQRGESYLLKLPVFRAVYAPVRQLVAAFSSDNEMGFKRVVLVDDPKTGYVLGFLTKEFMLDRGEGDELLLAVYVPTNHLYLGDVRIFPKNRAVYPDLTVQEGIRIFLTGGMAVSEAINAARTEREDPLVVVSARGGEEKASRLTAVDHES